jgi:glutaredoxin
MTVVVFTGKGCNQCVNLKKQLTEAEIVFEEKDIYANMDIARDLNIRALPTTVIYDETGEVAYKFLGGSTFPQIKGALAQ